MKKTGAESQFQGKAAVWRLRHCVGARRQGIALGSHGRNKLKVYRKHKKCFRATESSPISSAINIKDANAEERMN
jgi:hypothetical protein